VVEAEPGGGVDVAREAGAGASRQPASSTSAAPIVHAGVFVVIFQQ
jgi:hypothetical protein